MAKFGTEYRGEWMMMDDVTIIRVSVFDTENIIPNEEPVNVIPLRMSGNPLSISIIDSSRDKFTPIKARQAKIEVLTENAINLNTFSGSDNRWSVDININPSTDNKVLFNGFLSLADMSVNFLPDPNILTLTATDHLGMLKDIPLTKDDGTNPTGKNRIIEYLTWILKKTGLLLSLNVVNNLRHGSSTLTNDVLFSFSGQYFVTNGLLTNFFYVGQQITISGSTSNDATITVTAVDNSGLVSQVYIDVPIISELATSVTFTDESSSSHLYWGTYLDAKTFEAEIGESEDCYTVLEKILGEDCYLTQYNGAWWIVRVEELDNSGWYITNFDTDGIPGTTTLSTAYNKSVGSTEDFKMALADMILEADRPHGIAKLTYNYQYPNEIPCNSDFSRGDLISDTNPLDITYNLDCWTLREGVPGYYGTVDGTTVTIHRIFNINTYEIERYIVLTPRTTFETSSIDDATYIESEAIEIQEKDKFTASISFRMPTDIATGGNGSARLFRVVLNGDDGSWWILGNAVNSNNENIWYNTSNWTLFSAEGSTVVDFDDDDTEWRNINWTSSPVPISGNLYIWINQLNQLNSSDDNLDIWYNNLQFDYIPFINGSYQKYSGQYHKVSRDPDNYLAKRENEVYVSDSPKPILKGGMYFNNGTALILTSQFYDYHKFPSGTPTYIKPYGEHQIRSVFNQYRNANRVFNGSIQGTGLNWCDVIHKYSLTDINPNTDNRFFMLTSFEQNWKTGYWTGQFIECWNTDDRVLTDDLEFKYITK